MDFDQKLDELKHHVDEVQASVQEAATENRASVKQRIDRAQRDIDEATLEASRDVLDASEATRSRWSQVKADASAKLASTKATAAHRADALDARIASTEADAAKADAYSAIDFADWAVETRDSRCSTPSMPASMRTALPLGPRHSARDLRSGGRLADRPIAARDPPRYTARVREPLLRVSRGRRP